MSLELKKFEKVPTESKNLLGQAEEIFRDSKFYLLFNTTVIVEHDEMSRELNILFALEKALFVCSDPRFCSHLMRRFGDPRICVQLNS